MQSAKTVLGVLRERGRRGLPCEELYRHLFNPQLYLVAYGRIYANQRRWVVEVGLDRGVLAHALHKLAGRDREHVQAPEDDSVCLSRRPPELNGFERVSRAVDADHQSTGTKDVLTRPVGLRDRGEIAERVQRRVGRLPSHTDPQGANADWWGEVEVHAGMIPNRSVNESRRAIHSRDVTERERSTEVGPEPVLMHKATAWSGRPPGPARLRVVAPAPIPSTIDLGRAEQTRPRASRSFVQWRAPPGRHEPRPLHRRVGRRRTGRELGK
jgi:hypothetical protein